ncbi:hypothetical protein A2310_05965 [candidate division WOR-1 bacterium RIFOXYB2_FULL_37_13]|uniref:Uncharacterized protein n=1 Tax=candidate division WOR-1 bacterium RIFOXYB2_FULL_37_13 TaxID=1802579 RepID=A0A1F4SEX5_UNCSA|nr:MAG: hypothetical protein A2310_05965 [candidate division WOR-1 bacterium RIFOXYB2_FULL_37_13]
MNDPKVSGDGYLNILKYGNQKLSREQIDKIKATNDKGVGAAQTFVYAKTEGDTVIITSSSDPQPKDSVKVDLSDGLSFEELKALGINPQEIDFITISARGWKLIGETETQPGTEAEIIDGKEASLASKKVSEYADREGISEETAWKLYFDKEAHLDRVSPTDKTKRLAAEESIQQEYIEYQLDPDNMGKAFTGFLNEAKNVPADSIITKNDPKDATELRRLAFGSRFNARIQKEILGVTVPIGTKCEDINNADKIFEWAKNTKTLKEPPPPAIQQLEGAKGETSPSLAAASTPIETSLLETPLSEPETIEKAKALFAEAFTYSKESKTVTINDEALIQLQTLIEQSAREGFQSPKLIEIARRINPELKPEDHALIFEFENAKDAKTKNAAAEKTYQRVGQLAKNEIDNYDGFVSTSKSAALKRLNAFWWALDCILLNADAKKVDQKLGEIASKATINYRNLLNDFSFLYNSDFTINRKLSLLNKLKRNTPILPQERPILTSIIEDASFDLSRAPLGSQAKINAYRRLCVLTNIALSMGISDSEINARMEKTSMPGIDLKREHEFFAKFGEAVSSPEKTDDYAVRADVLEQIDRVAQSCNKAKASYFANPTTQSQEIFKSTEILLATYISIALEVGFSYEQIRSLLSTDNIFDPPARNTGFSLNEVKTKGAVELSPLDLPAEVTAILKELDVYDNICEDVTGIYFTNEINSKVAERTMGGAGGEAIPYIRKIWIDSLTPEGTIESPQMLAMVIIHEWLHVKWEIDNQNNKELLRSLPNERNSFLGGAKFMKIYLATLISKHKNELQEYETLKAAYLAVKISEPDAPIPPRLFELENGIVKITSEIALTIYSDEITGLAANSILRYPANDTSQRTDIFEGSEELDLDTYPTNLSGGYGKQIDQWIASSGLQEESAEETKMLYQWILSGDADIAGSSYDNKIYGATVRNFTVPTNTLLDESQPFAPLIPIQQYYSLSATGMTKDIDLYSICWHNNSLYKLNQGAFNDAARAFVEKTAHLDIKDYSKIFPAILVVLEDSYVSTIGLKEYLDNNYMYLKNIFIRSYSLNNFQAETAIELLKFLANYKIDIPQQYNISNSATAITICYLATNSWRFDQNILASILQAQGQQKILQECGYPAS